MARWAKLGSLISILSMLAAAWPMQQVLAQDGDSGGLELIGVEDEWTIKSVTSDPVTFVFDLRVANTGDGSIQITSAQLQFPHLKEIQVPGSLLITKCDPSQLSTGCTLQARSADIIRFSISGRELPQVGTYVGTLALEYTDEALQFLVKPVKWTVSNIDPEAPTVGVRVTNWLQGVVYQWLHLSRVKASFDDWATLLILLILLLVVLAIIRFFRRKFRFGPQPLGPVCVVAVDSESGKEGLDQVSLSISEKLRTIDVPPEFDPGAPLRSTEFSALVASSPVPSANFFNLIIGFVEKFLRRQKGYEVKHLLITRAIKPSTGILLTIRERASGKATTLEPIWKEDEESAQQSAAYAIFHFLRTRKSVEKNIPRWERIPDAETLEAYYEGARAYGKDDYPTAIAKFSSVVEKLPAHMEAKYYLASAYELNYDTRRPPSTKNLTMALHCYLQIVNDWNCFYGPKERLATFLSYSKLLEGYWESITPIWVKEEIRYLMGELANYYKEKRYPRRTSADLDRVISWSKQSTNPEPPTQACFSTLALTIYEDLERELQYLRVYRKWIDVAFKNLLQLVTGRGEFVEKLPSYFFSHLGISPKNNPRIELASLIHLGILMLDMHSHPSHVQDYRNRIMKYQEYWYLSWEVKYYFALFYANVPKQDAGQEETDQKESLRILRELRRDPSQPLTSEFVYADPDLIPLHKNKEFQSLFEKHGDEPSKQERKIKGMLQRIRFLEEISKQSKTLWEDATEMQRKSHHLLNERVEKELAIWSALNDWSKEVQPNEIKDDSFIQKGLWRMVGATTAIPSEDTVEYSGKEQAKAHFERLQWHWEMLMRCTLEKIRLWDERDYISEGLKSNDDKVAEKFDQWGEESRRTWVGLIDWAQKVQKDQTTVLDLSYQ